ncbi:hypothetical protein NMG46_10815 [Mesorhizobium sp. LMG 17147]|uniref:DUF805 domain-containing protein n=1 Tax=Mesorhizobium sp. LMG 17147 TaxID=2963091 RepID=UPI0020C98EA5|nr:hypothetical protein [Mesorhizobium sp. LMG 17147]MCP9230732.1 hypothetical protein [Mesorhizobium sp. LMG 17147]
MFSSNIGRLRFFFYSVALLVAEIVTFVLCVVLTIGIEGLANSKPGPSREGLAAAVLVASLVIFLFRANFAWRRSRDAQGSGWILWSYIVFSTLFAILQAGTVLVVKFDGEDSHSGLNLLGLALVGLWAVILGGQAGGRWLFGYGIIPEFRRFRPARAAAPHRGAPFSVSRGRDGPGSSLRHARRAGAVEPCCISTCISGNRPAAGRRLRQAGPCVTCLAASRP